MIALLLATVHYGWPDVDNDSTRSGEILCWWSPEVAARVSYLLGGSEPRPDTVASATRAAPWVRKSKRLLVGQQVLLSIAWPATPPAAGQYYDCKIKAGATLRRFKGSPLTAQSWSVPVS